MPERPVELKKLIEAATDMDLPPTLRMDAVQGIGMMGTHEALAALLELAGDESLIRQERELALKYAMRIVKSGH